MQEIVTFKRHERQSHNNFPEGEKRHVVLHVGPHKTGTTFLQKLLLDLSSSLRSDGCSDGYATPGGYIFGYHRGLKSTANVAMSLDPIQQGLQPDPNKTLASFESFLNSSYTDNLSVVLSSEEFDRPALGREKLLNFFRGRWDSLVIVVTYRRLFEWCLSFYFEVHKGKSSEFEGFVDWFTKQPVDTTSILTQLRGYFVMERYETLLKPEKERIVVMNIHSNSSIEEDFFCQVIADANNTCSSIKHQGGAKPANVGSTLDFKRLALAAKERGLVGSNMNIEEIVKSIRERHRYLSYWNGSPFWYCLGQDDILKLFQDSMREELEMVPDWFYAQGGEKALRNDFNHFVTQGGLCSMNITAVLNNQSLVGSLLVQQ